MPLLVSREKSKNEGILGKHPQVEIRPEVEIQTDTYTARCSLAIPNKTC